MTPVSPNPILGTLLHAFGATAAVFCYTPQQRLRGWSWQTYWLAQAMICWLIAPVVVAWLTVPRLIEVLKSVPPGAMGLTFGLGMLYGIGGTAFGVAIRYIGYSLTYAIAIGISCMLGTFAGPVWRGEIASLLEKAGAGWVFCGVFVGLLGTLICGLAGRLKENELQQGGVAAQPFVLGKGLALCILAGIFSAVYGIAVNDAGKPIALAAEHFGAGHWQTNAVYIFSNSGAFVTTAAYSVWLALSQKTFGEYRKARSDTAGALGVNYLMALLTGCLWYGQFFFYGLGHVRMGQFEFSSWAIHMLMLILFSSGVGILLREWHGRRPRTIAVIVLAMAVLAVAVLSLAYGNYLGDPAAK
ncbi:MAG: rhamnose:proton symporter [Phycisphaerae bacterium]|nr:rhamnose:proton symporter [Phycisphaerae bacterium]